ncbi:double-stranded RNA-binding protein Staufen homolog 1 [Fopius arisanus]|uniref:Double-stranded RNA-binding protein Staufen homolog 1 n=1 Tax=Fopius arisanus TaxID=64838 RepID=A0A0C9RCZ7_9HYME|nr:PREDICTED: double-stranded RNA-binding protein Staufen homolog 1-like [Fopius arisanus]
MATNGDVERIVSSVQALNELMMKRRDSPQYELIYDGRSRGDGVFTYQVSCFDHTISASGDSKKNAKQNAAQLMLNLIKHDRDPFCGSDKPKREVWWTKMPINVLQTICRYEALSYPDYEELGVSGPPHARLFTTRCTVSSLTRKGEGQTKKQAKQMAARSMIIFLCEISESVRERIKKLETLTKTDKTGFQADDRNENVNKLNSSVYNDSPEKNPQEIQTPKRSDVIIEKCKTNSLPVTSPPFNINERINDLTLNVEKKSKAENQQLHWPQGSLMCQRRSVRRTLQKLNKSLNQKCLKITEEFVSSIYEEIERILAFFNLVSDQIIQRTADGKFMMALYVSTNPMILDVAVDDDQSSLTALVYRRLVQSILDMLEG